VQQSQWLVRNERPVLALILCVGCLVQVVVTLLTSGGGDLQYAYVPTVSSILHGQNPYLSNQPWNTGYPPFFFLVLAGIALVGSIGGSVSLAVISVSLRAGLVIGHSTLGGLAYLTLRKMKCDLVVRLGVPALVSFLPSFYQMGEVWFHADVFGLVLLTGAVYMLHQEQWITGSMLLSLSTAFKIHPILTLPLLAIWLFRKGKMTLTILSALFLPFLALTVVPLPSLPGYYGTFVQQNITVRPSWSFSPFIIAYKVFPSLFNIEFSTMLVDQIWILTTIALFSFVAGFAWRTPNSLRAVDVVCLGVATWLIPLRQLFHYYAFWAIIPFMLRGNLKQTILALLPLEAACDLAAYAWTVQPDWVLTQQSTGLLLSVFDMTLLVASITTCAYLVLRTAIREETTREIRLDQLELLAPVSS
jgi:hypothetical protein